MRELFCARHYLPRSSKGINIALLYTESCIPLSRHIVPVDRIVDRIVDRRARDRTV